MEDTKEMVIERHMRDSEHKAISLYDSGYRKGKEQGYEEGYSKGYEDALKKPHELKPEYKVGDVLECSGTKVLVTYIEPKERRFSGVGIDGCTYSRRPFDDWSKTDRDFSESLHIIFEAIKTAIPIKEGGPL